MKPFLSLSLLLGLLCPSQPSAQTIPPSAGEVLSSTRIQRGSPGDQFGRSVALIGDLDGDGVDDLAVGASHSDDGANNAGSVWILFMNAGGTVRVSKKISSTMGGFTGPLNADNQFGKSVIGLGDMDGDGVIDIAVGAASATTPADRAVYTLFMNTDGSVKGWNRIDNTTLGFARALTNMGDFDGDGIVDIMVGSGQGRAWLYYLNADGTEKTSRTYFARSDNSGGLPNFYGIGMSAIGDWDGDGVTDVLIGNTGNDLGGTDLGVMYISLVNPIGFPKQEIPLYDGLPGFNLGLVDYPNFGRDACVIGDLDGNGVQEIAIGCAEWYGGSDPLDSGAVFVAFMEQDGTILEHRRISLTSGNLGQPIGAGVEFGISVSPVGDLNGDGVQDIAVGARFGGSGSLYLLRMNDGTQEVLDANGVASTRTGNLPLDVQFTDLSMGTPTSWLWEFGDGTSSNLQHPLHTYNSVGSFFVTLHVGDALGNTDSRGFTGSIDVGPSLAVTADFTSNAVLGVAPLAVTFSDTSIGIVDDWLWDFGDGNTSTLQNPLHTYTGVGSYTVSLDISNSGESDSISRVNWITVQAPAPTAAFVASAVSGLSPLDVSFTDQSLDAPTSWLWDFGDGGSSTQQNPMHTFTTGTYTVALMATNATGSDSLSLVDLVVVDPPAPVAAFSVDLQGGGAPLTVQFTDLSTLAPVSWSWDFGDGNTSAAQHPQHIYLSAGSYLVSLMVSNPSGSDSALLGAPIVVVNAAPVASFMADQVGGETPLLVQFSDTSSDDPQSWDWDFGDGATSDQQNPSHLYTQAGSFVVSLTVANPLGSDQALAPAPIVTFDPIPVASFSVDLDTGIVPVSVSFTDTSSEVPTAWAWDFGDGNSSTDQNPVHLYTSVGSYTVTLDASNATGSTHFELPMPISVLPVPPAADFVADIFEGITPISVQFTDLTSLGPNTWFWSFGDGASSTAQHPLHVYTEPGAYTVTLRVTAPTGQDVEKKLHYIHPGLVTDLHGGLFEAQLPNGTPTMPWVLASGAAHRVLSFHKMGQPGMPSQGNQWLRLSGAGSRSATPPSAPGGLTEASQGGAGVRQSFLLPAGRYELSFAAAFQLSGAFGNAADNDWMSVDISNGEETYNLFYRDSFSDFNAPRFEHLLPSTPLAHVRANLAEIFPHARAGTVLTLSMQVGNGADDERVSLGHLDDFRLQSSDLLQVYGSEKNPAGSMQVEGRARLGESLVFRMDNPLGSQCLGSTNVQLFLSRAPEGSFPAGLALGSYGMDGQGGEILIDWSSPSQRFLRLEASAWGGAGNPAVVELRIPKLVELIGFELYAQGLFVDTSANCGTRLGLTQAVRLVVGP